MATSELDKRPAQTVDPNEEPSVEWGWHGSFPRAVQIAGWLSAIALVIMAFVGNHKGHVEVVWLVGIAVVMAIMLIRDQVKRRNSWRR